MSERGTVILNIVAMFMITLTISLIVRFHYVDDVKETKVENAQVEKPVKKEKVKDLAYPDHLKELISQYEKDLLSLSDEQKAVMLTVADLTFDSDLAYTAAAQIWTESEFGKYPVDLEGLSCGLGHKRMNFYVKEIGLPETSFSRNKQCSLFINDHKLSIEVYLKDFEYWKNYHLSKGASKRDAYINAIKSYNAGRNVNSKDAQRYYDKVRARVIVLQKHYDFKTLVANMRGVEPTMLATK